MSLMTIFRFNMPQKTLRIATRKSPLALWQANHIRTRMLHLWPELNIELLPMTTSGDNFLNDKLLALGGKGLFVKELEEALLDRRADFAVHSMKDVPAVLPDGLSLVAICKRDNPLDALISPSFERLATLPLNAIIGTSSLRRQSQLLALRPDFRIKTLRGNIHTRLEKMKTKAFDAIILAAAGLERMGMSSLITETLHEDILLPACGQGALGIECRTQDEELQHYLAPLNDPASSRCVEVERSVNALLGGNCHVPLAVYCINTADSSLHLRAKVATPDGRVVIHHTQTGHERDAMALASACAKALLDKGAAQLLSIP